MTIRKDSTSSSSKVPTTKESVLNNQFTETLSDSMSPTDMTEAGSFYVNTIQMEDYILNPYKTITKNFEAIPLLAEMSEFEDSLESLKGTTSSFTTFSNSTLLKLTRGVGPRSYISVFNDFRPDVESFDWLHAHSKKQNSQLLQKT